MYGHILTCIYILMGQQRTILSIRKETRQMFKKLNKMKIGARLKKSFRQIILIFGILSALVVVIMLYTIKLSFALR